MKYFAYDRINGDFEVVDTEQEAKELAEGYLDYYRGQAPGDGWPEDMQDAIGYGPVTFSCEYKIKASRSDYASDEEWEEEGYSCEWDHIAECNLLSRAVTNE